MHRRGVEDLAKGKKAGNYCRDLRRRLTKGSHVPKPYWFSVPTYDKKKKKYETSLVPCILPHDMFQAVASHSPKSIPSLYPTETHGEHMLDKVREVEGKWSIPAGTLIPLGLWGDGAPMASKGRESHEALSWNFCTLPHGERYFFFGLQKSMCAGRATWDAVFGVWAWSMQHLLAGKYPTRTL